MTPQHHLPADIERTSMAIITEELQARGADIPPENAAVVKRVIHTTADFDYAENLQFTPGAAVAGVAAMHAGATIITDTNMALAGITKPGLARLGGRASALWKIPPWPRQPERLGPPGRWLPYTMLRSSIPARCWRSAMPPRRCLPSQRRSRRVCARRLSSACRSAL